MRVSIFITCLLGLVFSCNLPNKGIQEKTDLSIDSLQVDSTQKHILKKDTLWCSVRMNIKYLSGKGASKLNKLILSDNIFPPFCNNDSLQNLSLKKRVNSFIQRFFNELVTNVPSINNEFSTSENRYAYHYILETTINSYKDNIISCVYHHTLAINELSEDDKWTECKNINIVTKKILTLEDIFVRGYEYTLNSLIERQLLKLFKAKDTDELLQQNVLLTDDISAPKNFIIKEDEMVFIYNNGEITNTNIGEIEIKIKNKDLKEILKDRE